MSTLVHQLTNGSVPHIKSGSPPRPLTEQQLDDVLSVVPRVMAACHQVSDAVHAQICKKLRMQLKELVICPEGIQHLKDDIVSMFDDSRIQPGTTVGMGTAEGSGQPITQMTLNSFHQTGSAATVSRGIEAVRELFNMTVKRKHESTTIHFRKKDLSFEEVLNLRRQLVGISVGDLLKTKTYAEQILPVDQREWWYNTYLAVMGKTSLNTQYYLRLVFDTNKLYSYYITLDEICRILEVEPVKCVASPTFEGIIDVYPDENAVGRTVNEKLGTNHGGITKTKAPLFYLQHFMVPNLNKLIIRGIRGIQQIFPYSIPTWSIVKHEERYFSKGEQGLYIQNLIQQGKAMNEVHIEEQRIARMWKIHFDLIKLRTTGIPISKFISLLLQANIQVISPAISDDPNKRVIQYDQIDNESPPDLLVIVLPTDEDPATLPGTRINKLLELDIAATVAAEDAQKKAGVTYPQRKTSTLSRSGNYVYAVANGTSLRNVLSHPLVDPTTTICNNYHEIAATLGIEAARNFLIRDYYDIFTYNAAYVNYRYIALIVDFQTSLGTLLSVTSRGVARQRTSVLTQASFDHPMDTFINASAFGKKDDVVNVSTAIYLGKRALVGTGSFDLELDAKALQMAEVEQEALRVRLANPDEMQSAIDRIGDIEFDTTTLQFDEGHTTELNAMFNRNPPTGSPRVPVQNARYQETPTQAVPSSVKNPQTIAKRLDFGSSSQELETQVQQLIINNGISLCPKGPIPAVIPSILPLPPSIAELVGHITIRSPARTALPTSPPRTSPPRTSPPRTSPPLTAGVPSSEIRLPVLDLNRLVNRSGASKPTKEPSLIYVDSFLSD